MTPYGLGRRFLLFLAPVLAFVAVSEGIMARTGESHAMATIQRLEHQHAGRTVFQRSLLAEELRRYKWTEAVSRQPEILVVGSSTVMQIRSADFGPWAGRTYNAGGLVHEAVHLRELAEHLDAFPRLRLLVLGLDPWWWKVHLPPSRDPSIASILEGPEAARSWRAHLRALRRVLQAAVRTPSALRALIRDDATPYIGLGMGGRRGSGFRGRDGSYRYGEFVRASSGGPFTPNTRKYILRLRRRAGFFAPDLHPSPALLQHLNALLDAAEERGVLVVGFQPPLHPALLAAMHDTGHEWAYLSETREAVQRVFQRHHLPWLDALDPRHLGFGGEAFYDGLHASETVLASVVRDLLSTPRVKRTIPGLDGRFADALLRKATTSPRSLHLDPRDAPPGL